MSSVKIIKKEKDNIEVELGGMDQSLAQMLAEKLSARSEVEFAAYKLDHPIVASPMIIVKTKKGDASKILLEAIKELKEEISEFSEKVGEIIE
ncbi:hypothetical protein HY990_05240 [Candidatus Micrarchaeota archaeon]|nr:hypothetical protein [Candidatus Micrarchaeota archaeon]